MPGTAVRRWPLCGYRVLVRDSQPINLIRPCGCEIDPVVFGHCGYCSVLPAPEPEPERHLVITAAFGRTRAAHDSF